MLQCAFSYECFPKLVTTNWQATQVGCPTPQLEKYQTECEGASQRAKQRAQELPAHLTQAHLIYLLFLSENFYATSYATVLLLALLRVSG